MLLAAIGQQFESDLAHGDDIAGLSVSPRDRDDLIQVGKLTRCIERSLSTQKKIYQLTMTITDGFVRGKHQRPNIWFRDRYHNIFHYN